MILKKNYPRSQNSWDYGTKSQHFVRAELIIWDSSPKQCDEGGVVNGTIDAGYMDFSYPFHEMVGATGGSSGVTLCFNSEEAVAKFLMSYEHEIVLI